MGAIYRCNMNRQESAMCRELRDAIADKIGHGVTLTGNRLTVRWWRPDSKGEMHLVDIHMIIESVCTVQDNLDEEHLSAS